MQINTRNILAVTGRKEIKLTDGKPIWDTEEMKKFLENSEQWEFTNVTVGGKRLKRWVMVDERVDVMGALEVAAAGLDKEGRKELVEYCYLMDEIKVGKQLAREKIAAITEKGREEMERVGMGRRLRGKEEIWFEMNMEIYVRTEYEFKLGPCNDREELEAELARFEEKHDEEINWNLIWNKLRIAAQPGNISGWLFERHWKEDYKEKIDDIMKIRMERALKM